jgi:deoxyribodipyrimidine photolyase
LEQLGFAREATQLFSLGPRPVNGLGTGRLRGGEQEALRHLQAFISDVKEAHARCKGGADLQGENAGPVFSCKISPWLALGCVSPRTVSGTGACMCS